MPTQQGPSHVESTMSWFYMCVSILKYFCKAGSSTFTSAVGFPACLPENITSLCSFYTTPPIEPMVFPVRRAQRCWLGSTNCTAPTSLLLLNNRLGRHWFSNHWDAGGNGPSNLVFLKRKIVWWLESRMSHRDANPNPCYDSFCDPCPTLSTLGFSIDWGYTPPFETHNNELYLETICELTNVVRPKVFKVICHPREGISRRS